MKHMSEDNILFPDGRIAPMSDIEFGQIVEYMHSGYGIELKDKRTVVAGRLDGKMSGLGYGNYSDIIREIKNNPGGKTAKIFVDILTTNYTFFMREFEHFEFWKDKVLPGLRTRLAGTRDLRVWCAAASTGEEPYTIQMILNDYFGNDDLEWDMGILATDISVQSLQTAVRGIYPTESLSGLPFGWRERYFKRLDRDSFQVVDNIRKQITFSRFNLMDKFLFKKKMHTVFIRNVMIYFDNNTKVQLLKKLYDILEPGGYMFIGMTESIDSERTGFEYVRPAVYRKPLI